MPPRRGVRRGAPVLVGFLTGAATLVWTLCVVELAVTGIVIGGGPKTITTGGYRLSFCSVVLDETQGIDVVEVNASYSRIQIAYCCLLVLTPAVTGVLVGGLVKCLGFSTPTKAKGG